ncbi:MAG: molybdopterin cofactor-binding domain-containing protein, partial [Thermoplasmata archaeon]
MTVEGGVGQSIKRKEDPRFIRGQGNYIDDIELPDMVYMDIVRSPYAHAKITSIDTTEALKVPGVLAALTGKDLEAAGLAWVMTLMSDQQMVLPVDRVVHQGQEVVAIVAESRYAARDGVEAVDVDYEPLPVLVDPKKALEPDAPIIRPDREEQSNLIWHWEVGDKEGAEKALKEADTVVQEDFYIPRLNVSSLETCGCVAKVDKTSGQLTLWMTTQAPHAIRTVFALVTKLPEHKIRIISPDIGGGFGGKVYVYPGYVLAVVAALTLGRPVKWIEDRSDNMQSNAFGRDYHISAEMGAKDSKLTALRVHTLADHG